MRVARPGAHRRWEMTHGLPKQASWAQRSWPRAGSQTRMAEGARSAHWW